MSETELGREPIQLVEIEQSQCQLTYSEAPCEAELGVTGEIKCFNSFQTCQDEENYDQGTLTLTFSKNQQGLPKDQYIIPSLLDVTTTPTRINAAGGSKSSSPLGDRATVTATFMDHPHSDLQVDKYQSERNYIATDRGTFWTKWLARNPYYVNRIMRVREGYVGQAIEDMVTRTYIIDAIEGPDGNGRVTVRGKDILRLADNDTAQAPRPSSGELIQDYDEEASITELRITGADAADYPAPGTVRVNDELFTFTGVTTISSTEIRLTGITRATDGSELDDHDAEDRVQLCLRYSDVRVDDLAYEWLTDFGDVPPGFIDLTAWDEEASIWLQQFSLSGLITEPTGVTDLLGEITEQCLFFIWWDERTQLIGLKAIRPPTETPVVWDDRANLIGDMTRITAKPKERISQVWVHWGQKDPTQDVDEETNFRRIRVRIDPEAESDNQYGERRIRKIFSRWLQSEAQAIQVSVRLLARFRDNPRYMTFSVDAKDRQTWTADVADITHRGVVDDTGLPLQTRWQLISAEEVEPGHRVEYVGQVYEYGIGVRFGFWTESDHPDYVDSTDEERQTAAYWSNDDGIIPSDGSDGYLWQ